MVPVVCPHAISCVGTPKKWACGQSRLGPTGGDYRFSGCSLCPSRFPGGGDRIGGVEQERNGRTSTFRLQCFDPSAASLSTTSTSAASMIQTPARYSFDSRKGPSVKNQWPSAFSQSSNTLIAAISVAVAALVLSSITETRYCMSDYLLWFTSRLASHSRS